MAFYSHREKFKELFNLKTHGLTKSRYFRLIGFSITMLLLTIAASIAQLVVNLQGQMLPYKSWAAVHRHFNYVFGVRLSELTSQQIGANVASWLIPVLVSVIFFIFFGFAQEARKTYIELLSFCLPFLRNKTRK